MHRLLLRRRCRRVAFAILHSARNAGPRHHRAIAIRPVIPPVRRIGVTRSRHANLRRTPELANRHHHRLLQHPALIHILQQRRQRTVQLRAMQILQGSKVRRMRIPGCGFGVTVRDRRPIHLHKLRPRLNQSSRHQRALPERVHAITFPHGIFFLSQIKGISRLARQH